MRPGAPDRRVLGTPVQGVGRLKVNKPPRPVDDDGRNTEPGVRRSSEPQLRCTTSCGAEFRTRLSQSKPSTKSYGREAFTGISCKHKEMTPASHGSVRGSNSWEARVRSPELKTQSSETQERAARPSKPVDTVELQKVAAGDMGEKAKNLCALYGRRDGQG
ncbi:hypothetical protein B0H13DRAFT_1906544 [Mycena leptocephala]|nr:hypothetical protein B0H13DRAFT_1906544 [Mycena leptocephala]